MKSCISDTKNQFKYTNFIQNVFDFVEELQLTRDDLWHRFAHQFDHDADFDAGWRGEFWGKMMRGACFVYSYTHNPKLYESLSRTIDDIITCQDDLGRVSSYDISHEFDGWDIWGRKYVLLGMEYFLEICTDDKQKERIISSMCRQLDYIICKIGDAKEGKLPITSATRHWRGLNSSSILEPVVKLYNITGNKAYFDFAGYIADIGGTDVENIFNLAYEDKLYPYQYPVTKAYEMISCFEGLMELYKVTKEEKYLTSITNFADKILERDFTVIGTSGCTHELFDCSTFRQANTTNGDTMQETCVTVTLMKFLYNLTCLTSNPKYADAFEISFYNAYLGSLNTERVIEPSIKEKYPDLIIEPLPFDSYSPLTRGTRGNGVGGFRIMKDNHYYGCCACIGSLGVGLVPKMHLLADDDGFFMNMYIDGEVVSYTKNNTPVTFITETEYPKKADIKIRILTEREVSFDLSLRIPYWSKNTILKVNGKSIEVIKGYTKISRIWKSGDVIELILDLRCKAIYPIEYQDMILMNKVVWGKNYMVSTYDTQDINAKRHIALQYGPIMLSQDSRLGFDMSMPAGVKVNDDGYVDINVLEQSKAPYTSILQAEVPLINGNYMLTTDYSSAGKLWNKDSEISVWMLNS